METQRLLNSLSKSSFITLKSHIPHLSFHILLSLPNVLNALFGTWHLSDVSKSTCFLTFTSGACFSTELFSLLGSVVHLLLLSSPRVIASLYVVKLPESRGMFIAHMRFWLRLNAMAFLRYKSENPKTHLCSHDSQSIGFVTKNPCF